MTAEARDRIGDAERLYAWFAAFHPRIARAPIFDFARLRGSAPIFCEVAPRSAEEVSALVRRAAARGVSLVTRGCGHALNGSSLPRGDELLVRTRALTRIAPRWRGRIAAGAGAVVWAVDEWLRARGHALPVVNDGYAGPSVGGYVAAGGFGPGSRTAGGFWDNVAALTVVDGHGRIRRRHRSDALFPWLFGAMGQLGIVVEVELDTVARAQVAPLANGADLRGREADRRAGEEAGRLFWFTLFVPEPRLDEARAQLDELERAHPGAFTFRNRYVYFIPHRRVVAPLVWPHESGCWAIGSWGILADPSPLGVARVLAFDAAFTELALARGFRRYVQSGFPSGPALYARYFGAEIYARLRAHKREQDPHELFNRGLVFA